MYSNTGVEKLHIHACTHTYIHTLIYTYIHIQMYVCWYIPT